MAGQAFDVAGAGPVAESSGHVVQGPMAVRGKVREYGNA